MKTLSEKVNEYIQENELLKRKIKFINEDDISRLEKRVIGFLNAFEKKKVDEYKEEVIPKQPFLPHVYTNTETEKERHLLRMKEFLVKLKEELEVKEMIGSHYIKPTIEKVIKKAEHEKVEAERRKSVAEMKYWGFAIELIETVRKELKEFRQVQEELLKNIKELRDEIKNQMSKH